MIAVHHTTGRSVYFISFYGGWVWDVANSNWENPDSAQWDNYDIPATELSGTGIYQIPPPQSAGGYAFDELWVYERVGGTPAATDTLIEVIRDMGIRNTAKERALWVGSSSGLAWPCGTANQPTSLANAITMAAELWPYQTVTLYIDSSVTGTVSSASNSFRVICTDSFAWPSITPSASVVHLEHCTLTGTGAAAAPPAAIDCIFYSTSNNYYLPRIARRCLVMGSPNGYAYILANDGSWEDCSFVANRTWGSTYNPSIVLLSTASWLRLTRCSGVILSITKDLAYGSYHVDVYDSFSLAIGSGVVGYGSYKSYLTVYGLKLGNSPSWNYVTVQSPTNVSTFDSATNGVMLTAGAITASAFDGSTAFPLAVETESLAKKDDLLALSTIDETLDDVYGALIEEISNDVTGTVVSGDDDSGVYGNSTDFAEGLTSPSVSPSYCGGYCWPGYFGAFIVTLEAPIVAETALDTVLLRLTLSSTNTCNLSIEAVANPPALSGTTYNDRNWGSSIEIAATGYQVEERDFDVTALVNEMLAGVEPGTAVSRLCFGLAPASGNGPTIYLFENDTPPVLTIANPPTLNRRIEQVPDAVLEAVVEGELTLRQIARIVKAALAGNTTGGGTNTHRFKSADGTKDRIIATVDSSGNRTITVNGSDEDGGGGGGPV